MQPILVHEFLERSADRLPEKVALVCGDKRRTYSELEAEANRMAAVLLANGVQRGDRVVLCLPNSVELVVGIFGALKAGAVFVVIHPSTKFDKLAYIVEDCEARAIVTWVGKASEVERIAQAQGKPVFVLVVGARGRQFGPLLHDFESQLERAKSERPKHVNIDRDLACLVYTSGSTGDPKGVMSDHSNVVFAVDSITTYLENEESDVVVNVLPLSFDYGLYQVLMVFAFGGRVVLEHGFAYPAQVLERIQAEQVTGLPGVPTIFSVMLSMDLAPFDFSSIRYITNTAAALPPSHISQLRRVFPGAKLYSMYGLTETKRTLYLPVEYLDTKPDSVGVPIPGTEAWVEDENGHRVEPGTVGELVVRGRHVMRGYWGDSKATAERFRPGQLPNEHVCYTGDLFRMDNEGFFYFISRRDDIIKSRGEKVSPKEVENVIYRLDGVREVAVVGVPDPVLGQAIEAFVVSDRDDLTERAVLRHCRQHLEDLMVPRHVRLVAELPKTTSGKIKKVGLS
ncbi:MAG: AMP-binding protein [Anaerolineales bacterium]